MIINLIDTQFTLDTGNYYSPAFKIDSNDTLLTVGMYLTDTGTTSLQSSLNEVDWADIPDSSFVCNLFGLQTFSSADINLVLEQNQIKHQPKRIYLSNDYS